MGGKAIVVENQVDHLASVITSKWVTMNQDRIEWLNYGQEARRYVTSRDTATTEVGSLPWKNKTTIPKLTQIADNLHAYYMAALMPSEDWFIWEGFDQESRKKANYIERYMRVKLKMSGFRNELEKIIRDWITYGNCFGTVKWVQESIIDPRSQERILNYTGPKLIRVSPLDCVIDPRAPDIDNSPFIRRIVKPIGDIIESSDDYSPESIDKMKSIRGNLRKDFTDYFKDEGLSIDGFQSWDQYLDSQMVELIEYMGDIYDPVTETLLKNQIITIADRAWVVRQITNPAWNGKKPVGHSSWRVLPDNLYGQGPLDNLVGMQYRCDHLENLKADGFDQIVLPPIKIIGDTVEDFTWGPGAKIYCGAEGDVTAMSPDTTLLQCDNQIAMYHNYMETMAGSPREMAGFRTPGEKTAFEVDVLVQGADRMFMDKLNHIEGFIQRILNIQFELMMRNITAEDVSRTFKMDQEAMETFASITVDDVVGVGILQPSGAKHFAARNKRVQELSNLLQLLQNTSIAPHISGLRSAELFEEELGFDKYNLVEENVAIEEAGRTEAAKLFVTQQIQQIMQGTPTDDQPSEAGIEPRGPEPV